MARETPNPLTSDEAKARLLTAAGDAGLTGWTREHPLEGVSLAFALGLFTGGSPDLRRAVQDALLLLVREV